MGAQRVRRASPDSRLPRFGMRRRAAWVGSARGGSGRVRGESQPHLREVLPQEHARTVRRDGHDVELLAEAGDAAVAHNVRRVKADDLGRRLVRGLADVTDADLVLEAAKREPVDVVAVEAERVKRRDGPVVEPVDVRRVKVVLDNVAEVREEGEGMRGRVRRRLKRERVELSLPSLEIF